MRPRTESLTVTFVRHAESTNNIIERDTKLPARERLRHFLLAREANPALSKLGAAQADALHRHPALRALFGNTRAGKLELLLVASPMQRAWRTAEPLRAALGVEKILLSSRYAWAFGFRAKAASDVFTNLASHNTASASRVGSSALSWAPMGRRSWTSAWMACPRASLRRRMVSSTGASWRSRAAGRRRPGGPGVGGERRRRRRGAALRLSRRRFSPKERPLLRMGGTYTGSWCRTAI